MRGRVAVLESQRTRWSVLLRQRDELCAAQGAILTGDCSVRRDEKLVDLDREIRRVDDELDDVLGDLVRGFADVQRRLRRLSRLAVLATFLLLSWAVLLTWLSGRR